MNPYVDPTWIDPGGFGQVFPYGSFGCPGNGWPSPGAVPFTLTKTQDVVFAIQHHLTFTSPQVQLLQGCGPSASLIVKYPYDCKNHTATLGPGTYTLVSCERNWATMDFYTPPVPVGPNTTCNTAAAMPYTEPNPILDSNPRYYKFTVANWNTTLKIKGARTVGTVSIRVESQCGNSNTVIYSGSGSFCLTGQIPVALGLLNGTYWVTLTNMDPGTIPTVTL